MRESSSLFLTRISIQKNNVKTLFIRVVVMNLFLNEKKRYVIYRTPLMSSLTPFSYLFGLPFTFEILTLVYVL
jgi:hypothetical protein